MKKSEVEAINNFTVLYDTAEQKPFLFPKCRRVNLDYGDYTIEYNGVDYRDKIIIERKGGIGELYNLTGGKDGVGRERFIKELIRMKDVQYKYILCEFNYLDISHFDYGKTLPTTVMATIWSFCIKYQIPILFCGNRCQARATLYKLFQFYCRYEILKIHI